MKKWDTFLAASDTVLLAGKLAGLDEVAARVTLQQRAAEGRIGVVPPLAAPPQQFHRLPRDGLQLVPASVQFRLDVGQLQSRAPLGRLGDRRRFPLGVLPLLLGGDLGGLEAGGEFLARLGVLRDAAPCSASNFSTISRRSAAYSASAAERSPW